MLVHLMPTGPKNLLPLFPGVDWPRMDEYYLELYDDGENKVLITPLFKYGCCCVPDKVRVHFLNSLGTFDAINFNPPRVISEIKSTEYQRSLKHPLEKTDTGTERFNVRSTEMWECRTTCYGEADMNWCRELLQSPKAFIEWAGTEGQPDSFLPIKIEDAKPEKRKEEERYSYELVLVFKMSNDQIVIRN